MKKRLLFINQYYFPDFAATGQLLTQLTTSLTDEFDVTVLTAFPSYSVAPEIRRRYRGRLFVREMHQGVRVIRVFSTTFPRRFLPLRLINFCTYFLGVMVATLLVRKPDVIVAQTDPPFIALAALWCRLWRGGRVLVVFQDVFPEVAHVLGKLRGLPLWGMRRIRSLFFRSANGIVAISNGMRQALIERGAPAQKVSVIANWADTDAILPLAPENEFRVRHGLSGKFVVMHSGNVGLSQDFALVLDLAWYLSRLDVQIVIVGDGASRSWLEGVVRQRGLYNVKLLPYQPLELLSQSLSSADLHLVTLKPGLESFIVPSKLYGIMAAGRPVLAVVPKSSEVYDIVSKYRCGQVSEHNPKYLSQVVAALRESPEELQRMGRNGRDAVVTNFSRQRAVSQYKEVVRKLLS